MAPPLTRLAVAREPRAQQLRRALRSTLLGRVPPAERAWADRIEAHREALFALADPSGMPCVDAAGGHSIGSPETTVGVASAFLSLPAPWCRLLMRLIAEMAPRSCLELGTGFGISTAYLAAALELNGRGQLTTLDGSREYARRAADGLEQLGLRRVKLAVGPIAETLISEGERRAPVDFVFIDAEHQTLPTIEHFERVRPHLAENAVVAFDDADWLPVRRAVEQIRGRSGIAGWLMAGRFAFVIVGRHPVP